ncbi:ABC transporter ATP-binding protein [Myceligenerans pegani]|uniref:ABC transporter ATP-binding protein n=1 Tax=Myceligenerans pegani TaxID=2776917 RepID=A0ABR9N3L9_9MICO|nr:ABC transporter ATP-binding protein [Myceligenerans sp. TRM 65318]MBE1878255.1 ABC transporter ATP-binding protein [Myceligenerans sp. TRM 65318]MBE3020526.1 ABC transporter ATP-binding protein [Myceligenerans sp. TRM 65318]
MTLRTREVAWNRGGRLVVDGVTLHPRPGETVGLLGPNGSGKSSLLRLLSGAVRPTRGVVVLDDKALADTSRREAARAIATVTQHADTVVDITVRHVVALGRIPHRGTFGGDRRADAEAVAGALERTGLADKAAESWHRLSGGERQRVHIARALAQEPRELLLDEPTNHLDIRYQLELLRLITELPVTTVVALHDLNLAAMFCDSLLVLKDGRAVAAGTPDEVLTPELIARVYEVDARVGPDDETGRPRVTFSRGARTAATSAG